MSRLGYLTAVLLFVAWSLVCLALGAQLAIGHWIDGLTP